MLLICDQSRLCTGPGRFWVVSAQKCILPHSKQSFPLISDTSINTKIDNNFPLCFSQFQIVLWYFANLASLLFSFREKVIHR